MEIVKKLANDPNWAVRVRALTAMFPIRSQQQRQEAIQIALSREVKRP
jgi:HEAT repeat protein